MRIFCALTCLAVGWFTARTASANELYHLRFDGSDVGAYQTRFGHPTVHRSIGPFTDALIFHAITDYDQIQLPITTADDHYDIQFDLLTHHLTDSQYAFTFFLDTPQVRSVDLHGGNLSVFQPHTFDGAVRHFADDHAYHFDITVDLPNNRWSISVNGKLRYTNHIDATALDSIRFSMAPWTGVDPSDAAETYVALDNVVVNTGIVQGQRYVTGFVGATQTLRDAPGTGPQSFTKADFLRGVAAKQQPALDPTTLQLVFDTGSNQFLVVNRSDGATVEVVYTLASNHETDASTAEGTTGVTEVVRNADLLETGVSAPVGNVTGLLKRHSDEQGQLDRYHWAADFQVSSPTGGAFVSYSTTTEPGGHVPMTLQGRFRVRNREFLPTTTETH